MNPESPYIIPGQLPAFELAVENAFADYFAAAWGGVGGPLAGVRTLAGVRDFRLYADQPDPAPNDPAAIKADANAQADESRLARLYFVGTAYQRMTGYDRCLLRIRLEVNTRHPGQTSALFAQILGHLRATLSRGNVGNFSNGLNAWLPTQTSKDYQALQLQGYEAPPQPSTNAFHGLAAICEETYPVNGILVAS